MGFLGLRRPAWKHSDPEVRLTAVHTLDASAQDVLWDLARNDAEPRVRAAAAGRIDDVERLLSLQQTEDPALKRIATERLSGVADRFLRSKPLAECRPFLDRVNDQKSLAELSVRASDRRVREAAFEKLLHLEDVSDAMLQLVAIQDGSGDLAKQAVERITKRSILKDVARKAKSETVRIAAGTRAASIAEEAEKPSAEQQRKQRRAALDPLINQAMRLAVSSDWRSVPAAWTELERAWSVAVTALPEDPEITTLDSRFRRAREDSRSRCAMAEEADRAAALDREQAALAAQNAAASAAAAAAAPSTTVIELDAETRSQLEALAAEAEGLIDGGADARFRFQQLHKQWSLRAGDIPRNDPLADRFPAAYQAWKQRGRDRREERSQQTEERLATMDALCAEAEQLAVAADALGEGVPEPSVVEPHATAVKDLQGRWKAIGPVRFDLCQDRITRFRAAIDRAYRPINATREASDWERFTHLSHAEEVIARVDALASIEDLAAVAAGVRAAHQDWKQLGPLPRDKGQEAWLRFKALCDAQYARCQPYFAALDAERATNLERKRALLNELETILASGPVGLAGSPADILARRAAHERVKTMQEEWKAIGPVPRDNDQDLWSAWRKALDRWYAMGREQAEGRRAEQNENLTRKLGLIVAVEDLATSAEAAGASGPSPSHTMAEIKRLQATWKNIGHVPKEQADAVWARWKAACDRVYASLQGYLAQLDADRRDNLAKKEALINEVEELARHENPHWFKEDVREIMGRWREIGHIPREQMDTVNQRFRTACDAVLYAGIAKSEERVASSEA